MSSPITSSSFENQTPGQALCDAFQEKLLNNSKMQALLDYLFNDSDGTFASGFITDLMSFTAPVGSYKEFPTDLPSGVANPANGIVYIEANGQELLRADYARLFAFYGTTFNKSTDSDPTKFRVPDRSGKFPLGRSSSHAVGSTGGAESHALTLAETPPHNHQLLIGGSNGDSGTVEAGLQTVEDGHSGVSLGYLAATGDQPYVKSTGGNADTVPAADPHTNMPPFLTGIAYVVAGYKVSGAMV